MYIMYEDIRIHVGGARGNAGRIILLDYRLQYFPLEKGYPQVRKGI